MGEIWALFFIYCVFIAQKQIGKNTYINTFHLYARKLWFTISSFRHFLKRPFWVKVKNRTSKNLAVYLTHNLYVYFWSFLKFHIKHCLQTCLCCLFTFVQDLILRQNKNIYFTTAFGNFPQNRVVRMIIFKYLNQALILGQRGCPTRKYRNF